jgi:superfamily II DNA/RNA helicase
VLDEADQMLDSGFAPVIEEILTTTPDTRQMALFSATIPDWVDNLQKKFLKNPVKVDITSANDVQNTTEQIAYQVPQEQKMAALCTLLHATQGESSLVFGRTKYGVEKLGKQLSSLGFTVGTLHSNKSQRAREEVLTAFRRGQVQTLLATNVAARGLDITGIYQVINYELPESSDLFTHRIGRTGRMGRQGKAITLLAPSDLPKWRRMARSLGQAVALQRLAIDEEASVARPLARPAAVVTQGYEQNGEQRTERGRKQFSPEDRGTRVRPTHDSHMASDMKRPQKERVTNGTPARTPAKQPEGFTSLERPYSGKTRDGRSVAGKQSNFGRTTGKHKAHAFAATEPLPRTARRKPRATSVGRSRKAAASNRSASR